MKNINVTIGRRMRMVRLNSEETAKELAEILSCTDSTIYKYERGEVPLSSENVNLICDHYKINHRWFFTGQGTKATKSAQGQAELMPDIFEFHSKLSPQSKKDLGDFLNYILKLIK